MCGFLVTSHGMSVTPATSLRLRGPDESGATIVCGFALKSFRLSIVGQVDGVQPTRRGRSALVYNGEIYNFRELAAAHQLSAAAHASDTVCLHELLETLGAARAIPLLVGHFAFVWADDATRRVLFCRDHMGVKPLYFIHAGGELAVSSDIRTLADSTTRVIETEAALEAIIFGGHAGERTLYASIGAALPGVLYEYDVDGEALHRRPLSLGVLADPGDDELFDLIARSVREQAAVSVPAACLVSSGIDSRIVRSLVPADQPMAFVNAVSEELAFSRDDTNTEPGTIALSLSAGAAAGRFPEWLLAYGTVPAHNNYFALCMLYQHMAADSELNTPRRIKVALTGEGADEYFGGYGRYKQLSGYLAGDLSPWIDTLRSLTASWMFLMNARLHHSSLVWLGAHGVDVAGVAGYHVAATTCEAGERVSLDLLSRYDIQTNLRYGLHKQDVSGMLSSIEVRVPMVTQRLHRSAEDGSLAAATRDLSKLRLQTVAARLGIVQPRKIGFPVSLTPFVPEAYRPSAALQDRLPFARAADIPTEIATSLYMLDVLNQSCPVTA
jgi:asparagine synthase (glutamine-hydrolysing)